MKQHSAKKPAVRALAVLMAILLVLSAVPAVAIQASAATTDTWSGLADGEILIKDTITPITTGVVEHEVITNVPTGDQQRIDYIAEIKMSDTIKIVSGYGKNSASSWSLTSTTAQAAAYEADHPGETVVAAINADFFNMGTGEPMGALVMEGVVYHEANGRNYFGITKDGKAVIRNSSDLSDLQMAVGGDAILVQDGKVVEENGAYGALQYSRCAIGIKADGTVLTFVTYGLRAPISCGRTYNEIAQMMANAGCVTALALDGGGSATFCARYEGSNELVVANSPADGAEREVSSTVLIVSTAEATGVFDHAALTPNNEVYTPGSTVQFEAKGVDTAGMSVDLPAGTTWALSEESASMGTIDASTGIFTAGEAQGTVAVELLLNGEVVGLTTIEIAAPDQIYFANEEVSLGFEDTTDFGIVVRNQGRDVHFGDGDIIWTITDEAMGTFNGNLFTSADGESLNGYVTATSKWDSSVSGTIKVIVGMLPTIVWDFEDVTLDDGTVIDAQSYYIDGYTTTTEVTDAEGNITTEETTVSGILTHSNYSRGGQESIEIVTIDDDEPVRFGSGALKLNYDFINYSGGGAAEGACVGYSSGRMEIPGVPTGIGVWVYAPEGMGITYEGPGTQSGFWLRGYVRDGNNSNQPYDFVLEPKACVDENGNWNGVQPGIYWEGWMYLEADLTHLASPYAIQSGMTFRLMYVPGTGMGTMSAGAVYFDNLQFVYGTNVDDIDAPVIDAITVNGAELEDGAVIETNTLNITGMFHDVQNKYATGVDTSTVRMYIDGINVVDNDNYEYVLQPDGTMNYLYNLKLEDGLHTVTVSLRDGFGNEVSETRSFTINTGTEAETTVTVVPAEDSAIIGKTVALEIRASNDKVATSTTVLKLGNLFPDYTVTFSDNYNGESSYSNMSGQITVTATRKAEASVEDGHLIATVIVEIPASLNASASFTYTVKSGSFTTSDDYYATYYAAEAALPVAAAYSITADPVIVGEENAIINVTNAACEPAANVTIYLADDNTVIGTTDENGQLITSFFSTTAGKYIVYAKDADGLLSFQYAVGSYDPAGSADGLPYNIRFNAPADNTTQKNISWISNPLSEDQQSIMYAVSGSEEWVTVTANSELFTFTAGSNMSAVFNNVTLTGLTPGTTYQYKVGSGELWTEVDTFSTSTADATSTSFFVLGDIQADDLTNISTIRDILTSGSYDFGIQTGDAVDNPLNYFDWAEYTELFNGDTMGDVNMIQVLGNHEMLGDAPESKMMFGLPASSSGSHYSMTYGNVYLAVINYTTNSNELRDALAWLKEDAQASDADWKVLLMHQPAYYTNATGGNAEIYALVPNAVEEAGIDVVFSGHDHSMARTNPLTDDAVDEENGILYYICGSSGEKSYSVTTQSKFDYDTIFAYATIDFTAVYLTAESTKDTLTINVYDLGRGLYDSYTLESECLKNGHVEQFDPETETVACAVCGEPADNYTGDICDADGNEYYLMAGIKQTEWVTLGEEIRYYNPTTGVREELTIDETPSTCIIDGHCIYTSESGAVKRIEYTDAGGHGYEEQADGSFVCSACGHVRVNMTECTVTLSYDVCTYTGNPRTPATYAVAPDGTVLTKPGTSDYPDYYSTYTNNVEVGTASVTLTARKYGVYVNMNDWRGNCAGSITVNYEIRPDLPTNVHVIDQGTTALITWTAAKSAPTYVIYMSTDGETWNEIGTTDTTSYELKVADYANCTFKIGTRMVVDDKVYESVGMTSEFAFGPIVTAGNRESDGKPTLSWKNVKDAVSYEVYRSTSANGTYTKVYTTSYHTYTHASATVGNTYYYKVRAVYEDGTTSCFSEVLVNTALCGQPVLSGTANSDGIPALSWESVAGAYSYDVYRSDSSDGAYVKIGSTTETGYIDNTVDSKNTYYYQICAVTAKGDSGALSSPVAVTTVMVRPEPVVGNRFVDGKPTLSWESVDNAVSYQVYRSNSENGTYVKVFTTTGNTYTHASATVGSTYYYKVKAVFEDGQYKFSDVVKNTCVEGQFIVKATTRSIDGKPTLSWNNAEGAVSYQVYRSNTKDGTYVKVFTTTGNSYTHASSVVGNTYYYKVKVVYNNTSVYSSVVSAACTEGSFEITTGNRPSDGKPTLSWSKDASVAQYQVYRSNTKDGTYVRVFTTTGNTYTHASSVVDGTYYYKVKAVLYNGSTVFSSVVSNTRVCGQPQVTTGNRASDGKPTLKWDAVEGAASYKVYRANSENGKYVCVFTTTGTTYTHISAVAGQTYYYKVVALSANGNAGSYSSVLTCSVAEGS